MQVVHYHYSIDLTLGGVVRAVLDLAEHTASRGHEVVVVAAEGRDLPDDWDGRDGRPRAVTIGRPERPLLLLSRRQRDALAAEVTGADVLHLHESWIPSNVQAARIADRLRTPYVINPHGMLDDWCMRQRGLKKRMFLAVAGRRVFERAGAVCCGAEGELAQSQKWFPRGAGVVVPCLLDLEVYREQIGPALALEAFGPSGSGAIDPDLPLVLFLSRVDVKKGVEVLIDAAAMLREAGVACRVAVAGPGDASYMKSLRDRVAAHDLNAVVHFLGMVTGDRKKSLYEAADVFALPTSQENYGFVLPEALACGTPVVTTRGVDIWPELESSRGAMIVDRTPRAFADAIAALLRDDARRERMGREGREWTLRELTVERSMRRYLDAYEAAITRSARP